VGGNGIFGSTSNKRRKRILQKQASLLNEERFRQIDSSNKVRRTISDESREQTICIPGNRKLDATSGEDTNQQQRTNAHQNTQLQHHHHQQQICSVIKIIHNKWSNYIKRILMTMKNDDSNKDITITTPAHERISYLLATSEHVGMAVTIVGCNSRRHLVKSRCVVIDETKETWKMAMMISTKKKTKKKRRRKNQEEEEIRSNADNSSKEKEQNQGMSTSWSIIMVPKRGTTLHVNVPWNESSLNNKSLITSKQTTNHVTVCLES
jgi:hypothetical protein